MSGFSESSTVQAWLEERVSAFGWCVAPKSGLSHCETGALCEDWVVVPLVVPNSMRTTRIKSEQALFERLRIAGIADLGSGDE
jgi:hypothetical protein